MILMIIYKTIKWNQLLWFFFFYIFCFFVYNNFFHVFQSSRNIIELTFLFWFQFLTIFTDLLIIYQKLRLISSNVLPRTIISPEYTNTCSHVMPRWTSHLSPWNVVERCKQAHIHIVYEYAQILHML